MRTFTTKTYGMAAMAMPRARRAVAGSWAMTAIPASGGSCEKQTGVDFTLDHPNRGPQEALP